MRGRWWLDLSGRIALDFGVTGVPESFLINPAGVVVSKIVGGARASDLEDLLARAKSPPSPDNNEEGVAMDTIVYWLFGPGGCVLGIGAWMAVMAVRRRRHASGPNPTPIDAATAPCAEKSPQSAHPAEAQHG